MGELSKFCFIKKLEVLAQRQSLFCIIHPLIEAKIPSFF